MSATIPLPVRAPSRPHELFVRAWATQPATPAQPSAVAALMAACRRRVHDALAAWRNRREVRAMRLALMNLDDATLRDIGFVRAEIESVVAEAHGGVAVTRARLLGHAAPVGY